MDLPKERIIELGRQAYHRLTESPLNEEQKHLLIDCLEAYLPLSEQEREEFKRQIANDENPKVQAMNKTTFERGMEKGEAKALQNTILRQGGKKFGQPSGAVQSQIRDIADLALLQDLTDRMIDAGSWDELLQVANS